MGKIFCGIDWSEHHHDIALVDADGKLIVKRRIEETNAGWAELLAMLTNAGDRADEQIPVAIETPRGLLVVDLEVLRVAPVGGGQDIGAGVADGLVLSIVDIVWGMVGVAVFVVVPSENPEATASARDPNRT